MVNESFGPAPSLSVSTSALTDFGLAEEDQRLIGKVRSQVLQHAAGIHVFLPQPLCQPCRTPAVKARFEGNKAAQRALMQ